LSMPKPSTQDGRPTFVGPYFASMARRRGTEPLPCASAQVILDLRELLWPAREKSSGNTQQWRYSPGVIRGKHYTRLANAAPFVQARSAGLSNRKLQLGLQGFAAPGRETGRHRRLFSVWAKLMKKPAITRGAPCPVNSLAYTPLADGRRDKDSPFVYLVHGRGFVRFSLLWVA